MTDREFPPTVSIVTVNLNMAEGLARTLASVAGQDFASREQIVVDGGSTDGSGEVIARNRHTIARLVCEGDKGIYDAMNKGVGLASGKWVLFLNSGDTLASGNVLSRVFESGRGDDDILYGDVVVRYQDGSSRAAPAAAPKDLTTGMICSHQALFARRTLLESAPFTIGKIRSDYEFLLRCYAEGRQIQQLPIVVAEVEAGGLSDRKRMASLRERAILLRNSGLLSPVAAAHLARAFAWAVVTQPLKSVLPERFVGAGRRLKHAVFGPGGARG